MRTDKTLLIVPKIKPRPDEQLRIEKEALLKITTEQIRAEYVSPINYRIHKPAAVELEWPPSLATPDKQLFTPITVKKTRRAKQTIPIPTSD